MNELRDIAIIGRSCRLPGAASVTQLWDLLSSGTCAVSRIPEDRWSQQRLAHPRSNERGRSYTWSAGVLDDIWGFDPAAFGLSPREVEQMDPQQRLLLELTWEAFEDAAIKPSRLAGTEVGVFVGASALDYGNLRILDSPAGDAYFATGNALSIISNRISYVFDLHGPSFTVDTACSSGLVALNEAVVALRSGRIDTAVVGGVNVLSSPFGFIGFSQAAMLSRTGLCQAFSAKADGYVRAEGGVVLVLQTRQAAEAAENKIHGLIVESRINSDGRTTGISLPSKAFQAALLEQIYTQPGLDPSRLAFVEAHGTGTRVGDPVEAMALGEVLGRRRNETLPIGSIKTNIGHTEATSGLAGLLKAMLALEHDRLPASLHFDDPNPDIDFAGLNLDVCDAGLSLDRGDGTRLAGINSFGFGGTNAHVVLADAPLAIGRSQPSSPSFLLLSAHSRAALSELAADYAARLDQAAPQDVAKIIAAAGHRRERLAQRLVIPVESRDSLVATLTELPDEAADAKGSSRGTAVDREAPVAFVYSGNGSQWAGMGVVAYARSASFRMHFDAVSNCFEKLAGWSLTKMLHSETLATELKQTRIAQPLLFAIQSASTKALADSGLVPSFVVGHSVGEVAAAEAAGIFDLQQAVKVIHFRSLHQELTRGHGAMAVVIGSRRATDQLLSELPDLEIAATNSPRAFTVSGPQQDIESLSQSARAEKARVRRLDLAYPFHSPLMAPVEAPLLRDLAGLQPAEGTATFVSTVSAKVLPGSALDGAYWWRNVREPVHFMEATQEAARLGARIFVEIGPSATLLSHINDSLEPSGLNVGSFCVLDRKDRGEDPIRMAFATALARGARVDAHKAFGADPGSRVELPVYPWQRKSYRLPDSVESSGQIRVDRWHPLIGARFVTERLEWHSVIDTALLPYLDDHRIDGEVLLPGAAFVEMALAVVRDWLGSETATLAELEIVNPMHLAADSSREVLCRVIPVVNLLEILSRPRLSGTPWLTHVTAKIVREAPSSSKTPFVRAAPQAEVGAAQVYDFAHRSGLQFGPAFQQLASASRLAPDTIAVTLTGAAPSSDYGLDPARLDSCFHGLILIFSDMVAKDQRTAYVPVRFGEVRLLSPGAEIAHARIGIVRCDERSIIANFTLVDRHDAVIATLQGIRYQAIRISRESGLAAQSVVQTSILASEPTAARHDRPLHSSAIRDAASAAKRLSADEALAPEFVLLEGWATAVALHAARCLAKGADLDVESLVANGLLPRTARSWLVDLLQALESSGLATRVGRVWQVDAETTLPNPNMILRSFAADHPRSAAELLLAASAAASVDALIAGDLARFGRPLAASALDSFEIGGHQAGAAAFLLAQLLRTSLKTWPKDRAMRILQIGFGPLSGQAVALLPETGARLTVFDPERRRLERARLAFEGRRNIEFVDKSAELPANAFDLVIAAEAHGLISDPMMWPQLRQAMAQGAVFAAIEPAQSLFRDLVFGLNAARKADAPASGAAPGTSLSEAGWASMLKAAGLADVGVERVVSEAGAVLLLTGHAAVERRHRSGSGNVLIVGDGDARGTETTSSFATLLASSGLHVSISLDSEFNDDDHSDAADIVVFFASASEDNSAAVKSLAEKCLRLKRCVERLGTRKATIWIVTSGATNADGRVQGNVATGFWAFSRTLANEIQTLDVRRVDLAADLLPHTIAERLRDLVLSKTDETEIILDQAATRVVRFEVPATRERTRGQPAEAARLERGEGSGIDRIRWLPATRRPPAAGEVEIAVEATGLNFRDVMWGLGLLPEEILETGFAGATLGLECAGKILRVGTGVKSLAPGDQVIAFARSAFATHVTVPASVVALAPGNVSAETAATIPVAFLTAYYGLIFCARLQRQEWVLIHGGAGGVGLAALQIARWRGARVIATAGSPEKRALLRSLGAEHVFDSRSGAFAERVMQVTGSGVAVVLNSLSGEAMERSIGVLRPFGRFVELGKRDYVANTHIGLRPFRKNLSYFGVDLDQLLLNDPAAAKKLFQSVMALFAKGALSPLPHRSFEAHEIVDAFRLMQQSGHIGKLVVKPPKPQDIRLPSRTPFQVAADRTHLISGGFGGFGLETARWLVEKGARHIVLVGRSGASSETAAAVLEELAARGANVRAEALDIADKAAVQRLFATLGKTMPPLAGVIHAAMVLDDAAIANLDVDKFERVLRPKVAGAEHLDNLTRAMPLDYFVLFSSATTLIGNPGQGAYVAANGFLEGLARRRRRAGLPALAVAWGAIEDVGVLARSRATRETLATRAGVKAMKARDALTLMAEALSVTDATEQDVVVAIAPINWSTAREHLPVLRTPSYAGLARQEQTEANDRDKVNIAELLAQGSAEAVRKTVATLIVEEIARVLRLPREDVSRTSPLSEIGLDSLMAVELALGLEERFGLKGALTTSASGFSVVELADHVIGLASGSLTGGDVVAMGMVERHLGPDVDAEKLETASELVRQKSQNLKDILQ